MKDAKDGRKSNLYTSVWSHFTVAANEIAQHTDGNVDIRSNMAEHGRINFSMWLAYLPQVHAVLTWNVARIAAFKKMPSFIKEMVFLAWHIAFNNRTFNFFNRKYLEPCLMYQNWSGTTLDNEIGGDCAVV